MTQASADACRLCGLETEKSFAAEVLAKYQVAYHYCRECDYLQTEAPYWLDEAYARPITLQDTGVLQRNLMLAKTLALILHRNAFCDGRFLDYAGGYGILVRLMRDIGFDFYWNDTYTENLFAAGFAAGLEGRFEAISAFELLEHLSDPLAETGKLLEHTDTIVLSTELRAVAIPDLNWPYYGFGHGQHIGFFSRQSLEILADRLDARLLTDGQFVHLLTRNSGVEFPKLHGIRAKTAMRSLRKRMKSRMHQDSR